MERDTARPRPVPMPSLLVVKKGSKMRSRSAGSTPGPLSARAATRAARRRSPSVMGEPGGDGQAAARCRVRQRLLRVDQQVEHDLADLVAVGLDGRQAGQQRPA
jgi:hypothetical protein